MENLSVRAEQEVEFIGKKNVLKSTRMKILNEVTIISDSTKKIK